MYQKRFFFGLFIYFCLPLAAVAQPNLDWTLSGSIYSSTLEIDFAFNSTRLCAHDHNSDYHLIFDDPTAGPTAQYWTTAAGPGCSASPCDLPNTSGTDYVEAPTLAIAPLDSDLMMSAWVEVERSSDAAYTDTYRVVATYSTDGGANWQDPPATVDSIASLSGWFDFIGFRDPTLDLFTVNIAGQSKTFGALCWTYSTISRDDDIDPTSEILCSIWRPSTSAWTTPQTVSAAGLLSENPTVAGYNGTEGDVVVAWDFYTTTSSAHFLHWNRLPNVSSSTHTWDGVYSLPANSGFTNGNDPSIAVRRNGTTGGNLYIGFHDGGNLYVTATPDWHSAATLGSAYIYPTVEVVDESAGAFDSGNFAHISVPRNGRRVFVGYEAAPPPPGGGVTPPKEVGVAQYLDPGPYGNPLVQLDFDSLIDGTSSVRYPGICASESAITGGLVVDAFWLEPDGSGTYGELHHARGE